LPRHQEKKPVAADPDRLLNRYRANSSRDLERRDRSSRDFVFGSGFENGVDRESRLIFVGASI
jgi:hypothetical protein